MPKMAVFERSRRELSLDVSVGVHILLVVEQSRLESRSKVCAKTPILTVVLYKKTHRPIVVSLCRTLCAIKSMPASDCCAGAVNMLTLVCYFCGLHRVDL